MEIFTNKEAYVTAALFDFDGTISTLRCGWEKVMGPMMVEYIMACGKETEAEVKQLVDAWIDESTGIQTIFQMKWLAEQVAARGGEALDPWDYKAEYNRRLMLDIEIKKQELASGKVNPDTYLMAGSVEFLRALKEKGVNIYVASGTDHPDVITEAKALGVYEMFDEIAGAPLHEENCSKEAVLRRLISDHGLSGAQVVVVGDGKVEIMLGKEAGALTLGLASDEEKRSGVNPVKRARLIKAGADVIIGHGPHELRGIEIYNNCPIFYSLGDFILQLNSIPCAPADFYENYGLVGDEGMEKLLDTRSEGGKKGLMYDRKMLETFQRQTL